MKYFTAHKNEPKPFQASLATLEITRESYYSGVRFYGGNTFSLQRDKDIEAHLVHYPSAKCVVSFQIYRGDRVECIAVPRLHFSLESPPNGKESN